MNEKTIYTYFKYVIIGCLIIFTVYQFIQNRKLTAQLGDAILEMNKIGESVKINENLWRTTAYILPKKLEEIINANSELAKLIESRKEKVIMGTTYKTSTQLSNIPVETYKDSVAPEWRIASIVEPNGYYDFLAKYQIKDPWKFNIEKFNVPDSITIVQTKQPSGRISVYVKNTNPYIHIKDAETLIDPVLITNTKTIIEKNWKYQVSALVNPNNKNTDINAGIYTPFGLGIVTGYSFYKDREFLPNIGDNFKIGLSFLKDIK